MNSEEIEQMDKRIGLNADKLIAEHYKILRFKAKAKIADKNSKSGRKPFMLDNPIIDYIGKTTIYGLYAHWALDIIEGVARLDWDSKPSDTPLKSTPLSVKKLCHILASLDPISTKEIQISLDMDIRHAQRYMKACKLMMPYLIKSIPKDTKIRCVEWLDLHDLVPDPVQLAKLHHDMRDL